LWRTHNEVGRRIGLAFNDPARVESRVRRRVFTIVALASLLLLVITVSLAEVEAK
jgi:hypothetical protein